jgi:hypothetical protein
MKPIARNCAPQAHTQMGSHQCRPAELPALRAAHLESIPPGNHPSLAAAVHSANLFRPTGILFRPSRLIGGKGLRPPFRQQGRFRQGLIAAFLFLLQLGQAPAWAQTPATPPPAPQLRIVVVEGDGAINNIRQRVSQEPVVQVEDENHMPAAGAAVVFFLPNDGPSGEFPNGTRTLTLTTNAQGRATAAGIRRNNLSGQMQIRVTASYQGQTASAVIIQTNVASTSGAGLSTRAKVLLILGIAGGAAAGAVAATHNGGGSTSTTAPPAISITAGTPTVGAPQ